MNKELFKYYKMHKLVSVYVEIENTDSFLTGFINSLDDEGFIEKIEHNILKINQIDEEGKTDGVSFIKMFQINSCQCDTIDEQIIMQLYQNK
jgi:DNA-directed RNA polymerase specialized sigma54-like protein